MTVEYEHLSNDEMNADLQKRADSDFIKRALPGVYLYLCVWPVIFYWTGFHDKHPGISIWFGAGFFTVCGLRLIHTYLTDRLYDNHYRLWYSSLFVLVNCHAVLWGAMFYMANLRAEFASISMLVNLATISIITASMISLIPRYTIAQIYVSIILLPLGIGVLIVAPEQWQLTVFTGFFWAYMMFVGRRFYREYVRAFKIERALSEKQWELEKLSQTDALTGLNNRFYFDQCFEQLWQQCQRNQSSIALLMMDIDHFKKVNDDYGHPVGDDCLVHAGKLIEEKVKRATDYSFRYGGEEFAVLLTNIDQEHAIGIAEDIRKNFEETPFTQNDLTLSMTISIGLCVIQPDKNKSSKKLLDKADEALYEAKKSGRNRVKSLSYLAELNSENSHQARQPPKER
ncbi:MAG: GGDEF domain-containing protein [Aestuariibacter sp.]